MSIIGIVATDRNGAIGKGGKLPWHYSSDLKFFKATTTGNACVMGHTTWQTLKKPLPDRLNVVLSRHSEINLQPSLLVLRDPESVLSLYRYLKGHLFVIGGAKAYEVFLSHIERWIVTEIPITVENADTFMPANYLEGFRSVESQPLAEGLTVRFYERK
jgi:dihydrofolate reductase